MPEAENDAISEEELEGAAPTAGAAKKKKNKKKKNAGGAGGDAADEIAEAAAAIEAATPAAAPKAKAAAKAPAAKAAGKAAAKAAPAPPAEVGGGEGSGEDDDDEDGAAVGKSKKKKKNKKKPKGEAGEEQAVAEDAAAPAAPETEPAAPEVAGDSGDDEDGEGAGGGGKKKKKKPKKKGGNVVTAQKGAEVFEKWCAQALEATINGTEKMTKEEHVASSKAFLGYSFSGNLRPCHVTEQVNMPEGTLCPDYATHPEGFSQCERIPPKEVPILEGQALETMREACRLGREVLDIAGRFMKAGVTGDEIDRIVYQACVDRKIYPSPLNYFRFPKSVCVSPNEVICHGIPDCRPIEEGDIVNLDISIYHQGFHSDLNETFFIGQCDEDAQRLVRCAYNALHAAAKEIRPGTLYRDLGHHIHGEASKAGCAVVTTYCGHGVGELFHGPPKVPHYRKNKAVGIMKPGHVFTVEPMINLGNNGGDKKWPDDWTAVTLDGKRSAQFEHTFLVTETGLEVLTARPGMDRFSMPSFDTAMFQR